MWLVKAFKAVVKFYDEHPTAKIVTGGICGGIGGVLSAGGAHLLNSGYTKKYGDVSSQAAAIAAKEARESAKIAVQAAGVAKKTAVDTINLASQFVETK